MLELLLLFATGAIVPPLVKLYLRFFAAQGSRHEGFEAWCRARPLVFALFVPRTGGARAAASLQAHVQAGFVNVAGGFPWGNYRVRFDVEPLGDDVVGFRIRDVRVLRGRESFASCRAMVDAASQTRGVIVQEMWLHGELWPRGDGEETEDAASGWRGHRDETTGLHFTLCPELPYWLQQTIGRGPPRRERRDDAASLADVPALVPTGTT